VVSSALNEFTILLVLGPAVSVFIYSHTLRLRTGLFFYLMSALASLRRGVSPPASLSEFRRLPGRGDTMDPNGPNSGGEKEEFPGCDPQLPAIDLMTSTNTVVMNSPQDSLADSILENISDSDSEDSSLLGRTTSPDTVTISEPPPQNSTLALETSESRCSRGVMLSSCGVALALIGGLCFALQDRVNYWVVHSAWHLCAIGSVYVLTRGYALGGCSSCLRMSDESNMCHAE